MISVSINIIFIIFAPFLFMGIIIKTKAFCAGRKGPSIIQPFYDFIKLLNKGEVISEVSSPVFKIAPVIYLATAIFAALLLPIGSKYPILSFNGDFIVFAYILSLGRFFSILGAMDTGSSFEGMGASREASFSAFIEPAFFIIISSIIYMTGYKSFKEIFFLLPDFKDINLIITAMAVISFFIIMLVEGCRVPVDDPNTHLELTMIHEVIILDNSGPDLAFILYGAAIKIILIASIIINFILPGTLPLLHFTLLFIALLVLIAIVIGIIESFMARMRMTHIPEFALSLSSVGLLALSVAILSSAGGIK